jgi:hypothetical protein
LFFVGVRNNFRRQWEIKGEGKDWDKGDKGDKGDKRDKGDKGDKGENE